MKTIKEHLNNIEKQEKTVDKIARFLKTVRGQRFVSKLHTAPFRELCSRFEVPKFIIYYKNRDTWNMNLILAAMRKYEITIDTPKPSSAEIVPIKREKIQIMLTKKELAEFEAKRPRKMGFAALMHAYEEHKMQKFEKKNPAPTEKELKEDLFPEELLAGYRNMLYVRREYIRDMLSKKYGKVERSRPYFRVFKVLSITTDPATGNTHDPVVSEVELDRKFVGDRKTPKDNVATRLRAMALSEFDADSNCKKVKLYNKYGKLLRSVTRINHKNKQAVGAKIAA